MPFPRARYAARVRINLREMPKKRLALLIALAAAAVALVVVLVLTVVSIGAQPGCEQVRDNTLDEERYDRLKELARFTEALAVLEHAHEKYGSLSEARRLAEKFESLPTLSGAQTGLTQTRRESTFEPGGPHPTRDLRGPPRCPEAPCLGDEWR